MPPRVDGSPLRPEPVESARKVYGGQDPEAVKAFDEIVRNIEDRLNTPGGVTLTVSGRAFLASTTVGGQPESSGRKVPLVQVPGLDDDDLIEWARLEHRWAIDAFSLALSPAR